MVFVRETPNLEWMMTGGTPIDGTPHISNQVWLSLDFQTQIYQVGELLANDMPGSLKRSSFQQQPFSPAISSFGWI